MVWTDNRDVVPGEDPREEEQDGFDVDQCLVDLGAPRSPSDDDGPRARSDAPFSGNNCGNNGGVDQKIYGNRVSRSVAAVSEQNRARAATAALVPCPPRMPRLPSAADGRLHRPRSAVRPRPRSSSRSRTTRPSRRVGADGDAAPGGDLVPARRRRPDPRQQPRRRAAGRTSCGATAARSLAVTDLDDPFALGRAAGRRRGRSSTTSRSRARTSSRWRCATTRTTTRASPDSGPSRGSRSGCGSWPSTTTSRTEQPLTGTVAVRAPAVAPAARPGPSTASRRSPPRRPAGTRSGRGTTCSRSRVRGSSRSSRAGRCSPRVAAITSRVRLGLMVGANTFRNPGLTTKLATTLDHVSNGRAILGIGGAWFEREHEAFGIDFGASVGERLDRLERGRAADAPPARRRAGQPRGPLLHASSTRCASRARSRPTCRSSSAAAGPKKTLRTVARHADGWNTSGDVETVKGHARHPRRRTAPTRAGTCPTIELTVSFPTIIRDTVEDAEAAARGAARRTTASTSAGGVPHAPRARPTTIAETLRPVPRARLLDGHRPHARAVRPRDDRPAARGARAPRRLSGRQPMAAPAPRRPARRRRRRREAGARAAGPPRRRTWSSSSTPPTTSSATACSSRPTTTRSCTRSPGIDNREWGWGLAGETFAAAAMLERYGEETWFRLGDRDLATHIVRTARLRRGDRPTDVARDLQRALGVAARDPADDRRGRSGPRS